MKRSHSKIHCKDELAWPAQMLTCSPQVLSFVLRPWQTKPHCCRHIVAHTNVSLFASARNICCRHKLSVRDTKNVSHFVQKHFESATNVSQFSQPKKHHERQCVRKNVSSFTRALSNGTCLLALTCFCKYQTGRAF